MSLSQSNQLQVEVVGLFWVENIADFMWQPDLLETYPTSPEHQSIQLRSREAGKPKPSAAPQGTHCLGWSST